jgi:hypothetical protein
MKREGWTMKLGYAAAIAMVMAFPSMGRAAQSCDARAFGVQIDQAAQALRTLNHESEKRFHARLDVLAKKHGWTDAQRADKAAAAMDDAKLEAFNNDIEELASQLDALSATANSDVSCNRLGELKTVQEKLVAVMGQKSGFILAQLEAEGAKAPVSPYAKQPMPAAAQQPATAPVAPRQQAEIEQPAPAWSANLAQTPAPPPAQRQASAPAQPGAPLQLRPAPQQQPDARVAALPKPQTAPVTPPPAPVAPPPAESGYSAEEIHQVGKGVFGTLTSDLAVLVNRTFKQYGQPNAYIVGGEGGGAFLAGLRYGEGKLFTRFNGIDTGPTPIYWQGPTLGADFGANGAQTLFLVYNLQDAASLYRRFPGLDGSAYVAGGLGMTVYRGGDTLIVPIRTGLGLRLGASIAYLKFTERASLNPFW